MPSARLIVYSVILLAAMSLAACSSLPQFPLPSPPGSGPIAPSATSLDREVHDRINQHRQSAGLPLLAWDATLAELAARHSAQMASGTRPFGHDGFEERVETARASLAVGRISENVATNNYQVAQTAQQAVAGWIGSPGHRRNLEGDYQVTGVGVARSLAGQYFFTQIFAAP